MVSGDDGMRKLAANGAIMVVALTVSGCQTTEEENWIGGERKSFAQAERACEEMTSRVSEAQQRPEYFVGCMQAYGWQPRAGTTFATPGNAPDPS